MSAKISGGLPSGDRNGIGPILRALVDQPHRQHVALVVMDCNKIITDNDSGDVVPTIRLRRIEIVLRQDLPAAEQLLRRALEKRSGATVLPLELEDELTVAFAQVDPKTGEAYGTE